MAPTSVQWLLSSAFLTEDEVERLPEQVRYSLKRSPNWDWSPLGLYVNRVHPDNLPDESRIKKAS